MIIFYYYYTTTTTATTTITTSFSFCQLLTAFSTCYAESTKSNFWRLPDIYLPDTQLMDVKAPSHY